ncbi:MAG: hypothetical protein KJ906_01370 [Nanoarchaeota archaeon]|nr:hypothetical protein [Nanoarchaeota archaeon]
MSPFVKGSKEGQKFINDVIKITEKLSKRDEYSLEKGTCCCPQKNYYFNI